MDLSSPIIHVITRLEAGGAPRSLLLLLEGLKDKGLQIELATGLTRPPVEDMLPEAEALGIPVHVIKTFRRNPNPWYDLLTLISLWKLFRTRKPAIVHTHTSKAGFLGRLAALLAFVKVRIYSPRGTILEGYFSGPVKRFFTLLEKVSAGWTDAIIGLTSEESDSYLSAGIGRPDQHLHIPIGIDSKPFTPPDDTLRLAMRREESVSDDEVLIISTGRLVPVKDHATLIRGLGLLTDVSIPWKCWILGAGQEEERLRNLIRETGLQNNILLRGHTNEVSRLLGLGDIFVLTSVNEGFGRALLEAMAARLPIIATNVGGIPTVLDGGEAGVLIQPSDPRALAEALGKMIVSQSERSRFAQIGYQRVLTVFDLETTVDQHIELYERLTGAGP